MKDLKFHDAANIFPLIDGDEFDALVEDIRTNGLRESIKLLDGMVLDGRNRYRACLLANHKATFETVATNDPVSYVLSLNLHRRHLTPSQSAMCAARAREIYERQAKERQKLSEGRGQKGMENLPHLNTGAARDIAGKAFGVSGKSVDHATRVIEKGVPELVKAVDDGRMAVSTAAILATEPNDVQLAELSDPKRNRVYKPEDKKIKSETNGKPFVKVAASSAMSFAQMAILQLERIDIKDPKRSDAFRKVENWIERNE